MYKLTFDDKPEANTYVKWARGKGYLVEGPYRERLSKTVKKFDLNGKRKKFSFVVLRKRGVGREGGDVFPMDMPKRIKVKKEPGAGIVKTTTDYWETNPEEIRRIATKMGIPSDKPLPKVLVMEKGAGKEYSESPMLVKSSLEADKASGYVINIPESMLKRVTKKGKETNYILGSRVKENIRHELAHYEERSKTGEETGQEKTPYEEAVKEIKTDMRAKVKSMPRALALQSYRLKEKYGLGDKEAFKVIEKAAKDLGVKKGTITRARGWEITSKAEPQAGMQKPKPYEYWKEEAEKINNKIERLASGTKLIEEGFATNPDGSVTFKGYHGTFMGRVPSEGTKALREVGFHAGDKETAKRLLLGKASMVKVFKNEKRLAEMQNPKLIQVDVTLQKPLGSVDKPLSEWDWGQYNNPSHPEMLQQLRDKGYDGVIYRNEHENVGAISVIAFDMKSVKEEKPAKAKVSTKDAIHEKLMADAEKMPIGSKSPEVKAPKKIPERLIEDASKLPIGSRAPLEPKKQRGSPKGSGKKISSKLQPLAAEAAKYDKFDDFEKAFSHEIRHGRYYHVTDNPNFKIDPSTGPQDASSMAGKPVPAKGKLMITSDLDNWAAEYKGKRQYVAIIDMGEVPKEKYWQVNRGFGNEFWVDDPSRAKVIKVVPMTQAKVDSRLHHKALPSSKEELKGFYEKAKEVSKGKPAKAEIPIQPEIKKVMTGEETKPTKESIKQFIKEKKRVPLKVLREHREVVKEEQQKRHEAKKELETEKLQVSVSSPRYYWDAHLEENPLRTGRHDTDAGAFTVWMIESAGDVLRESYKQKYSDPSYIYEKLNRIERGLKGRDWTDPISAGEQERLAKTRKLLEDLPAKTHKDKAIKRLIEGTVKRDREQTSEALREVKQHLVEEKAIKQSIKERKRVPLKELRKYREVVKEEHEARKEAKAYKERVREYKERAEKADREEAKYWEETKLTAEQQSREEEVEALKAEAEAYEKSGVVKEATV